MKPIVASDLDGVLAEFCLGFTTYAAEMGLVDKPLRHPEQKTWHFDFPVDPVWKRIAREPDFWENLELLISERERLELEWLAQDCSILYVTARHAPDSTTQREMIQQTERWLKARGLPEGVVLYLPDKHSVLGALKHQLVSMIDDSPAVLTALKRLNIPAFARDWEYNRGVAVPRGTVSEFIAHLYGVIGKPPNPEEVDR